MNYQQTLIATGATSQVAIFGVFNFTLSGTFSGSVVVQRSFDGGTTWDNVTSADGSALRYTNPCSVVGTETEGGVQYRASATLSSGSVAVRFSA